MYTFKKFVLFLVLFYASMISVAFISTKIVIADPMFMTYFLPQHKDMVMKKQHDLIVNAEKNIDVAMYSLTAAKNNSYADDLIAACKKGIHVRLLRDQVQSTSKISKAVNEAIDKFKNCEVRVKLVAKPIMHSKMLIVDGRQVFWGSLNESKSSPDETNIVEYNENGEIFESAFADWWKDSMPLKDFETKKSKGKKK